MNDPIRVLICGTGGGAHVLAGLFSTQPDVDVRVFTQNADKIRRWRESMRRNELLTVTVRQNGHGDRVALRAQPFTVTDEPEQARDCDFIIFAVPAFMHGTYLN